MIKFIRDFIKYSRIMFLTCTIIPVLLGGALASEYLGSINILLFIYTMVGVCLAHLGVNLSNDYFDFKLGADIVNDSEKPYSGGGGSITRGGLLPQKIFRWYFLCFLLALLIGLSIIWWIEEGKILVLSIMILGFLGGYYYTAPPFQFSYRGLGELDIFIFLGPAPILGTFAVLTGTITLQVLLCSIPIAGLITAVLWINEYTDYETDKKAGKKNLVVRLGLKNARWGLILITALIYLSILFLYLLDFVKYTFLLGLLTLPLAMISVKIAFFNYYEPEKIKKAQAYYIIVHLITGLLCVLGIFLGKLV